LKRQNYKFLTQPFKQTVSIEVKFRLKLLKIKLINNMERKEFLNLVGMSVGAIILQNCMSGCTKASDPVPVTPPVSGGGNVGGGNTTVVGLTGNNQLSKGAIDFTIDLTSTTFGDLKTNGKALVSGDVIIARTKNGDFLVVEKACTHQGTTIDFKSDTTSFSCSNHGSTFDEGGKVTNGPATVALKKYSSTFDSAKNTVKIS
jgi:cytochrome b6-f complex iron-sulfur subunit